MNVLFVSNLFPNCHEPTRGVFNLHQIRHLAQRCAVRVVAPVAWFPVMGQFAPPHSVPAVEKIAGLSVTHPSAFYLPKIGRTLNPWFYAVSLQRRLARFRREFPFDIIYVNWAYPDGCAMAKVARALRVPFVVSVSGSDANLYLNHYRIRRRQLLRMFAAASQITVRSRALRELLKAHGVDDRKIHVVYNGVDRVLFAPQDRAGACRQLSLSPERRRILYVGNLVPIKGPNYLAEAFRRMMDLSDVDLIVIGRGPQTQAFNGLPRVRLLGPRLQHEIAQWMNACDVLCLPSVQEGLPNVVLEALACGLPVVASCVGGVPELIQPNATGLMVPPNDPTALATALRQALTTAWDRRQITASVATFDWDLNAQNVWQILTDACTVGA